jgi:hypothetical protein
MTSPVPDRAPTGPFRYTPACSQPGCTAAAVYKVAAVWRDGTFRELKTYALACPEHLEPLRIAAADRHARLVLRDEEAVEPLGVYLLASAPRDADRHRID